MSSTSELRVTRWRRYGKDRLYVSDVDERRRGWCDLTTGVITVDHDVDRPAVTEAVESWRASNLEGAPAPAGAPPTPATLVPTPQDVEHAAGARITSEVQPATEQHWDDLAARRAGQAAREQAVALRTAAPVRTFVSRVFGIHTDERAWRMGADGEEKVAARLARLVKKDPRWRVLHAVPVGENGSDIDHVVIGPAGVFTLNAKHHPGAKIWVAGTTFMVNGQKQPYLRNSRHEAARAATLLTAACGIPVEVVGVVVPVGASDVTVKAAPDGARVVYRKAIARWLARQPEVLDEETVERIYGAARRSTTWVR